MAELLDSKRIAVLGAPGTGKTTWVAEVAKTHSLHQTASTHLAALGMGRNGKTIQSLLFQLGKSRRQVLKQLLGKDYLVVDEFTMVTAAELERLFTLDIGLIFTGDFEQLQAIDGGGPTREWLIANGFVIHELEKIHRASDDQTLRLYQACRGAAAADIVALCEAHGVVTAKWPAVEWPPLGTRAHYVASVNEVVNALNIGYGRKSFKETDDELRARSVEAAAWGADGKLLEAPAVPGMLVIGLPDPMGSKRKGATLRNQEVAELLDPKAGTADAPRYLVRSLRTNEEYKVPPSRVHPGFAITFHRCQGQTFDCPVQVDTRNTFEKEMLYVAVTRVRRLEQLRLITA